MANSVSFWFFCAQHLNFDILATFILMFFLNFVS